MFKRILWKLTLSLLVVFWALISLVPLKDREFEEYVGARASARTDEFAALLRDASQRVTDGQEPSAYIALRNIANEREIDLSIYFPHVNLERTLRNVQRRNGILLEHLLKQSKGRLQLGLDLRGGVAFTLEVPAEALGDVPADVRQEKLSKAIEIIDSRINAFGVAEPLVRPIGDNRIEVQLPGVSSRDNPEVVDSLKKPARLEFRVAHPTLSPGPGREIPPGYEIMTLEQELRTGELRAHELFVKRIPEITGEAVSDSYPVMDDYGRYKIIIRFTSEGRTRFAEVTRQIEEENRRYNKVRGNYGQLAIVLDGRLYSAPSVEREIDSPSAEITGSFTQREAFELANVLNNPLDLPLEVMEQYEVGPSLAEDSIRSGIRAATIGGILVASFMILYYRVGGVVAIVGIGINLLIVLGVLASFGATLTLPGLAALVLTIGMAVDANILIFERIREELSLGKNLPAALVGGYEKVFSTILDANVTTLLVSGVMILYGTGPVKGFGITLSIGVFGTMFCALVINRMFLEFLIDSGFLKRLHMMSFVRSPAIDFVRMGRPAFVITWTIVLIGAVTTAARYDRIYGIDFVGGDEITLQFNERIDVGEIRQLAVTADLGEVNAVYQSELGTGREILRIQTEYERSDEVLAALEETFPEAGLVFLGENAIGPSIGKEIQANAFTAIGISLVIILLYVALRFEIGYGVGAVVATIHDILMTIGLFVLTDRQFTAPMVAAILLVVGYSLNDTIVVFDRIREELSLDKNSTLRRIINVSINKVFSRSLLTSITTLLAATSLYIFGGGVINDLSFTFIIGILTGTFSSIFVAAPVFYWWHKGDRKHVEDRHDLTPKYEWVASSKASQ